MTTKKKVTMTLSLKGYSRFKLLMSKLHFSNEDFFLCYCVLNTARTVVTPLQRRQVLREMRLLKSYKPLKR